MSTSSNDDTPPPTIEIGDLESGQESIWAPRARDSHADPRSDGPAPKPVESLLDPATLEPDPPVVWQSTEFGGTELDPLWTIVEPEPAPVPERIRGPIIPLEIVIPLVVLALLVVVFVSWTR